MRWGAIYSGKRNARVATTALLPRNRYIKITQPLFHHFVERFPLALLDEHPRVEDRCT